ncbi:YdgH/BhsA/McbA-like domain containing protein [Leclercia adecarboxylata]|uniref:YdgH/BhsA/McbA-like domain containing protein n=1 Tax=Leclercia adecarboxylata TaxID=83655 RepID=UPI00254BF501|nr:YdgH/BhsA/McbA-like domain containing protein [Leclercia adecarboxylata]
MKTLLIAVLTFTAVMASSAFAAQEVNQPQGLQKIGTVSDSSGTRSLADLEAKLQAKAAEAGASAFRITSAGGNNTLSGTADIYR